MSRWLKLLLLGLVVAGAGIFLLPWWLGVALRPVLRAQGVTFDRYERAGYARFNLQGVRYASASVEFTAKQVQAPTPLAWLAQRLRGAEPLLAAEGWLVQRRTGGTAQPSTAKQISGLPDLQAALHRLGPKFVSWLPRAQLTAGEVRGFGPAVTIDRIVWEKSVLTVDGVGVTGRRLAFVLTPATDGSITLVAQTLEKDARLQLVWSGAEIKGEAVFWEQPLQLAARFPAQGWLPAEASAVAENWRLPASRVKLGAPYAWVSGDFRLAWREGAFDLSAGAKAEPAADTKAPPFEARAVAQGTLRELTVTELHVDAPFASAKLTAPVTFSLDRPLAAESAQLVVQADLAKLPWLEAAHGKLDGTVIVTGDTAAARQAFEFKGSDIRVRGFSLKEVQARGVLAWPELKLTELKVQLDETSSLETHGVVNWQTRELAGVALSAQLGPAWFARWLPADAGWTALVATATAEGPLDAPRHQGSLKLTAAKLPPLQPFAAEATWQGTGPKTEITARAQAGQSSLDLTGTLEPGRLQLAKLHFAPSGQAGWQLTTPALIAWAPVWKIENLDLAGPDSRLTLRAQGGPEGTFEFIATRFDSAWLQDWITITGPAWQVQSLQAGGRVADRVLEWEATLAAQIEMSPAPAQVSLAAHGDAQGIELKELKVTQTGRVLTQATGRVPVIWAMTPTPHLVLDETARLELSASTEPDSPLWATLAAATGLELTQPAAKINLKGTLRQPTGELQIRVAQLTSTPGRLKFPLPEFKDLNLAVQLGRELVSVTTFSAQVDGQAVSAGGKLPMDDDQWRQLWRQPAAFDWSRAEARVDIPDADLAALARRFPDFIAAQGRLSAHVELQSGGKFSGELRLTNAATRGLGTLGALQDIQGDLVLADSLITVRTLTAKLGGEPVALDGSITLVPGGAPRLAVTLKGVNLPLVRHPGLLLRADLDLRANTDAAGLTQLGGAITVRDCLVLANINLRTLLPSGRRGVSRLPPYFAVQAEPFQHWRLDVALRAPNGAVQVRTTAYRGTASASFQLGGTLGEPRAVGALTVDEGRVLFPFATFKVQQGTVRLREADPFHAVVNLNATSQRRDYQLRLEMTGELPAPNVTLSSSPALAAADVLLMVMTGQPPAGETIPTVATNGPRLALLGAYLSRGLFQDLGFSGEERLEISAGEHVSRQGRDTYEFEYKLGERWSLLGEYDEFDAYNAGVKWRVYTQESTPLEKKNNPPRFRRLLLGLAALACVVQLGAAELHVKGLGWLNNRAAEQKLKLLLGKGEAVSLNAHALEDAALILVSELNGEGYLNPVLTVEATLADGQVVRHVLDARLEPALPRSLTAATATLSLEKGRRSTLSEVTFTGLLAMPEKDARAYFLGENTLIPLASARIYSPGRLQSSAGNLEEALRQLGYAEAEVIPEEVQADPEGDGVRVRIEVHEGRRWLVNTLQFAIADGSEAPVHLAGPRTDKPWNSFWRQDTATAIRAWYYARGRPDVQIRLVARTAPAADGTQAVTVTAEVVPGPEVHVGEVRFNGNTHTRDATLRRLVRSRPGALLNPIRFNDSQARISRLGVFRTVDLRYEPEEADTRDVVYDLVEGRRQEVSLLAGYGSYEQFRGGVEWRHYNLFGRAHTDSLKLVQSMKSSSADYTYTVPALFGTFTDGSARLFGWRREEFSFVNEEYGANFSVLWPLRRLGLLFTTGYTYKHQRVADSELASSATDQPQVDIASLDLAAVRERRDNALRPRKGYKLSAQAELANRALGGEVVYQQVVFGASYHTPWGKGRWVHLGFSQGTVLTLGAPDDTDLPVSVRFYPGGDGSIRGYQKGEAAPRNVDGLFVGAKSYAQLNVELEQALTSKWSAVLFFDGLGTAVSLRDYPFNEKLYSAGLGVRYQTIIGPVRLEYGHNLNPRPLDPAGTLLLSIGYPF